MRKLSSVYPWLYYITLGGFWHLFLCGIALSERIIFRASEGFEAISHVIGDTGLGFNFFVGSNRYYLFLPCFLTKDQELQQIIANVQSLGKAQTWQDILRMYKQLDVV